MALAYTLEIARFFLKDKHKNKQKKKTKQKQKLMSESNAFLNDNNVSCFANLRVWLHSCAYEHVTEQQANDKVCL